MMTWLDGKGKIMGLSLAVALLFWLLDAATCTMISHSGSFLSAVFVGGEKLYFRMLSSGFFLVFGWIVATAFARLKLSEANLKEEIGERKAAEQALSESEGKYRALVESADDSIYLVDPDCRYRFINRRHLLRLGLTAEETIGHPYSRFHNEDETAAFESRIEKVIETGESLQFEHQSRRDGRYFLKTLSPVRDTAGAVTAVTIVTKHISERKKLEDELRTLSLTDDLTGLYNRRGFFALAEQQLKMAHRASERRFLLYADLDNLKTVNDTWGHQEGDIALIDAANLLKETFRESDIIARIGGDEFVAFPVGHDEASAAGIVERLHRNLKEFNLRQKRTYELSFSVGVPAYDPAQPCSIDKLLALGDDLMYVEKKSKREPLFEETGTPAGSGHEAPA